MAYPPQFADGRGPDTARREFWPHSALPEYCPRDGSSRPLDGRGGFVPAAGRRRPGPSRGGDHAGGRGANHRGGEALTNDVVKLWGLNLSGPRANLLALSAARRPIDRDSAQLVHGARRAEATVAFALVLTVNIFPCLAPPVLQMFALGQARGGGDGGARFNRGVRGGRGAARGRAGARRLRDRGLQHRGPRRQGGR